MAKRERDTPGALIAVVPWWAWAILAVLTFLLFSWLVSPSSYGSGSAGLAPAVSRSWGRSLAFLAMIILPALFGLAAVASVLVRMTPQRRDAAQMAPAFGLEYEPGSDQSVPVEPLDSTRFSLPLLRTMEAKRLKAVCAAYFQSLRFRVEAARRGAEGAVDLRLYAGAATTPGILVQCKAWDWGEVGEKEVSELLGAMSMEKVGEGVLVTPGSFSAAARDFAADTGIHLIDGPDLLEKLLALDPEEQERMLRG